MRYSIWFEPELTPEKLRAEMDRRLEQNQKLYDQLLEQVKNAPAECRTEVVLRSLARATEAVGRSILF